MNKSQIMQYKVTNRHNFIICIEIRMFEAVWGRKYDNLKS